MKYTRTQELAINDCITWINTGYDARNPTFKIVGVAGTGKTTVITEIINQVNTSICIAAPTHKALRVVKNMTSGVSTFTIHSALGLRLNTDINNFDITKPNFDPLNKPKMVSFSVVIFDESSMIPTSLYGLILKMADTYKIKLIFVGDPLQLPPVNEWLSIALKPQKNYIELTEIVRQEKGHPILEPLALLRKDIVNNTDSYIRFLNANPVNMGKDIGYKVYTKMAFDQKMQIMFNREEYNTNIEFIKYLAYTNKAIIRANSFIRSNIIKDYDLAIITTDDLLTAYNSIVESKLQNAIITNSDDYVPRYIKRYVSPDGYKGFLVRLYNIYQKIETPMFILDHTHITMVDYVKKLSVLHEKAMSDRRKWTTFYEFKANNVSMIKFQMFNKYYPKGITVDRDLDYAYGSTIHKAQGSSYESAFIDLRDISTASRQSKRYKNMLLYVALSRVRQRAYILK